MIDDENIRWLKPKLLSLNWETSACSCNMNFTSLPKQPYKLGKHPEKKQDATVGPKQI